MRKNNIKIVKEEDHFGVIEYHYHDDKLFKKIDYTVPHPMVWKYNSKGKLKDIVPLEEKKSHKKLWMGTIGTLLIISLLCSKSCSTNKHKHSKQYRPPISFHSR